MRPHEPRPPRKNFETHSDISQSHLETDQITETAFHSLSAIYREMSAVASRSGCSKSLYCYNQLQQYLRHCTVFWLKWPVHDLVLVTPPPPLFKVASNTRPCSKLGGTTLNGGRRGVSILSHRLVTSSNLKQDRLFFHESVSTFLLLVVALILASLDTVKTFFSLIYTNVTIPYLYPLVNLFAMYFELPLCTIMHNFIV